MAKFLEFLKKNLKWFAVAAIIVLVVSNMVTCSRISGLKSENSRLENNVLAIGDTLKNYKDGKYMTAEMRAMQLKVKELSDSLRMEKGKTPITIVKYITSVRDSFIVETVVLHDTSYVDNVTGISDFGKIFSEEHSVFGKSSRSMRIETPYYVGCEDGMLHADGESTVTLEQDIWIENTVYSDKKGYTYMRVRTDYPGVVFNSGESIVVSDPKSDRSKRKSFGLGIGIQAGYGVAYPGRFCASPYIGIGIGLQWNPKFLQF